MKLMIVDDNDLMRQQIIKSVATENDIVFECRDGEGALYNYSKFSPDWILMDIRMTGINGISTAEKIKRVNSKAHIAFVTSYDSNSYRQKAKAIGIEYYFLKNDLLSIRPTIDNYKYTDEA